MTASSLRRLLACGLLSMSLSTNAFAQDTPPTDESSESAVSSELTEARAAYDKGDWSEAIKIYKAIYNSSSSTHTMRAEAALERSSILWEQGKYRSAKKLAEEALDLAQKERIDGAVGRLLVTIGHIEASQGKFSKAKKTFKICASLSEEGQDAVFAAICRMNLAMINRLHGEVASDDAQFKRDIEAIKSAKTPLSAGSALAKTGEMFAQSGDYVRAMAMLESAQAQFAAAGSTPAIARNRIRMARVYQSAGDFAKARAQLDAASAPLKKMNNRPALVDVYGLLGKDAEVSGDRDGAISSYKKALKTAESIGNPQLTARANLAMCELLVSPLTEGAGGYCDRAATSFGKLKIPVLEVRAKIAQANIHQQTGELMNARKAYTKIIDLMENKLPAAQRDAATLAAQRANLCQINNSLELTGALLSCQSAIDAITDLPDVSRYASHLATSYYNAGFSAQREERYKKALRHFELAASTYMKSTPSDPLRSADAHLRMGIIYSAVLKGEDNSLRSFNKGISTLAGVSGETARVLTTQLHQQLVQELVAQEQWQEAVKVANTLLTLADSYKDHAASAHAYNNLAVAKLKLGARDEAIAALEQGIFHAKKSGKVPDQLKLMKANLKKLKK